MIREICEFTRYIRSHCENCLMRNLQPKEGMHITIEIEKDGNFKHQAEFYKKNKEITTFLQNCLRREIHSRWISAQKALDSKKKIHSASPFCVAFKIKTIFEVVGRFDNYFDTAIAYCENDEQKQLAEMFRNFCKTRLLERLQEIMASIKEEKSSKGEFKFSDNHYILVYLDNASSQDYETVYQNYVRKKSFNAEKYNKKISGKIYGVGDYLTGYNEKKPFLHHRSATFSISKRISNDDAIELFYFSQLVANKQLPNPLPVFVDQDELNEEVVKIFNKEGDKRPGYAEIIKRIYERENDLGNYYLLNFSKGQLKDFDFVSSFHYKIPDIRMEEFFDVKGKLNCLHIKTIFDFEREIVHRIFTNQLIQKTKVGLRYRYFDEIDNKANYIRPVMFQLVMKYRKAFYDYIYKSNPQAVSSAIFHDIMQTTVLDDLRQDEFRDGMHSKSFAIQEKLNIWFNLYHYFDRPFEKGEHYTMIDCLENLHRHIDDIANNDDIYLANDNEFAYSAGQVIYYLLSCSEAGNKSHALLEPFLQKSHCEQFQMAIARTFGRYKHAIHFGKGKYEKLASQVLGYRTSANIKTLLPMILAGYFAKNIIYAKKAD